MGFSLYQVLGEESDAVKQHLNSTADISNDEIIRRLDYKTKIAVDELLALSSFTKKTLIYLSVIIGLSLYLTYVKTTQRRR